MVNMYQVRRIVSLILLVSLVLSASTGIILYLRSTDLLYWLVPFNTQAIAKLHTYSSFVMVGTSIIHLYLNINALVLYIKPRKTRKRRQ